MIEKWKFKKIKFSHIAPRTNYLVLKIVTLQIALKITPKRKKKRKKRKLKESPKIRSKALNKKLVGEKITLKQKILFFTRWFFSLGKVPRIMH